MVIYIGVPTSAFTHYLFASSLLGLVTYTKSIYPDCEIIYDPQEGVRTDRNRNIILERAYQHNFDYMLWLDSDMNFPSNMIVKYLEARKAVKWDIIGCLYFKGVAPYDPVGFLEKGTKGRYRPLEPGSITDMHVIEVEALGYGGMMVSRTVFDKMGDNKWTRYGSNFHLPERHDTEYQTHDIWWCEQAKQAGFKIHLHGGIHPTHIKMKEVGVEDWKREHEKESQNPSVHVIMPTIHQEQALKTLEILKTRAGCEFTNTVYPDDNRQGFVSLCNQEVKATKADYYVYLTDDIFPSRNWLKDALALMKEKKAGLVGFNDGKWQGLLATCGLVDATWMKKNYNGNLFFPGYFGHYNDTELTMIAMQDNKYAYDPNICLTEIDYEKETKKVHVPDRELYAMRKESNFDGLVTDDKLKQLFS